MSKTNGKSEALPKFSLGHVVATPGALDALKAAGDEFLTYLGRHHRGDWGDLCEEDKALNDEGLKGGGRLFSAYLLSDETKIWIITEWDRSATTLLLPSEY